MTDTVRHNRARCKLLARPQNDRGVSRPGDSYARSAVQVWPMTIAYVERIVPLALTLMLGATAVLPAVLLRSIIGADWLGVYERAYWPLQVALALVIVPQVAAWRE